ncbi:MAG: peroxiredoxin [Thaumarchaeota archaeon]|nr:peroxiredoxin [Nitrososphaerota archaeon]
MGVRVGDIAPDFKLESQTGGEVSLSQFRGNKNVVLYFYPKDETPGCVKEACTFRDSYKVFKEAGAEVIGVSSDSTDSHRKFADHHRLSFLLLSDTKGRLKKEYGVHSTLGLFPGRVTYVIDKEGKVRHIFSSQMHPERHVDEARKVLEKIEGIRREDEGASPALG